MFPRSKRLSRAVFPTTLPKGRRFSSPHFSILLPDLDRAKGYMVVVPKKFARLSVMRHRIKRQISAILHTLQLPPALIIFLHAPIIGVSYQNMKIEISELILKTSH